MLQLKADQFPVWGIKLTGLRFGKNLGLLCFALLASVVAMLLVRTSSTPCLYNINGRGPSAFANGPRWVQGSDLNRGPSGYEPDELPDCSTLHH